MKETYTHFLDCCQNSFELTFRKSHDHQSNEDSPRHTTCNFFGCFYALSKWFYLRRDHMKGLVLEGSAIAWILDDTPLVQLQHMLTNMASMFPNLGEDDKFLSNRKQEQMAQNCLLEVFLITATVIGDYYLVIGHLSESVKFKDNSRQRSFSNLLDLAICNPYLSGDLKRKFLEYIGQLLEFHIVPSIYYFQGSTSWNHRSSALGGYAEIQQVAYRDQMLCIKRYKREMMSKLFSEFCPHSFSVLRHFSHCPNVLPFYGIYNFPFSLMKISLSPISPYLPNTLKSYCKEFPSNNAKLLIIADIITAICHLHMEGVIPKSITPELILVSSNDHGYLSLSSRTYYSEKFYLGKLPADKIEEMMSNTASAFSLRYSSPEVSQGDSNVIINYKSNICSLASVIYEILTGCQPFFQIMSEDEVLLIILKGIGPSVPPMNDACWAANGGPLTEDIWKLLVKCWNKDHTKRPTLKEIYDCLHLGDIVDTRPPDNWPLAARFNDLCHSAQFITPQVIGDTFKLLKEVETTTNQR
ncbi:kinase-like domain-containing protein [Cyathus striatus]|nr:kinase-like domain-containing protein [Cyathus striatus]